MPRCAFFSLGRIRCRPASQAMTRIEPVSPCSWAISRPCATQARHYTLVRAMMTNSPSIRRMTVAGAGVLGAQIAFQAAVHGFNLFLYDINDSALEAGRRRLEGLKVAYDDDGVA